MDRQLEGTTRVGRRQRLALMVAGFAVVAALLAEVSGTRADDHYQLSLTFPWWGVVAVAAAGGLLWWGLYRPRSEPSVPEGAGTETPEGASAGDPAGAPVDSPGDPADAPVDPSQAAVRRIAVRSSQAITLIDVEEISHVEADGRYARIHTAGSEHLSQHSLGELERLLDGGRFVRVHRSAIVNLDRIRSLRTKDYRDFELRLDDGTAMRLSRTYRDRLEAALGLPLGRTTSA